jgi:uncharacterized protein YoaH (UPF0181 family)
MRRHLLPKISGWVGTLLAALVVTAEVQSRPDHYAFAQKADRFAFAIISSKSCAHLGYRDAYDDLTAAKRRLVEEGMARGIVRGDATAIIDQAIRAEGVREDKRVREVTRTPRDVDVITPFWDYWKNRCRALATDRVYGPLFRR